MKSYYKIAIKGKDTYTILNNILQSKINIYDAVLEKNTIILVLNYGLIKTFIKLIFLLLITSFFHLLECKNI